MRKQFVKTIEEILSKDNRLVVLLGDIGIFGFNNSFKNYPSRVYNIGILEQSTIGVAAGLSMNGLVPVVHTIAPFIVERGFEQIKDDFGYQKLGGNFVSVGASYDYAALGCTHHCPADVGVLKNIPGVEIIVPGTASEFDRLFKSSYADGKPTYFRLSEKSNTQSYDVEFGKAFIIKKGSKATVIAVGPMLDMVKEACKDLDVTILYYTTLAPFDEGTLANAISGKTIFVCEPFYEGTLSFDVSKALSKMSIMPRMVYIGVPREFIHYYGKSEDIDKHLKLRTEDIRERIVNNI
ncbi:MAG: transketolase C-terminal domain-containing protein [Patescibacteria group bacterium]